MLCRLTLPRLIWLATVFCTLLPTATGQETANETKNIVRERSTSARRALVIGNAAYKNASPLPCCTKDATDMASALKALGFTVHLHTDVTHQQMEQAIREFGSEVQPGDVALFYYSGHGTQVRGLNYLVPIGMNAADEDEIKYKAVPAEMVLEKLEKARSSVNLIVLDACRSNPFKRFKSLQRGLAQMNAPRGTLIAYATAPGTVALGARAGENSPYTKHLLQRMPGPEMEVGRVFRRVRAAVLDETNGRQVPWEASSLVGDFYFVTSAAVSGQGHTPSTRVEPRIHVLLATNTDAEHIAASCRADLANMERLYLDNIPPSRLNMRVLKGKFTPDGIMAAIRNDFDIRPVDTFVLYVSTLGVYDADQGGLSYYCNEGYLPRAAVIEAMRAKRPRLLVVLSDSCAAESKIDDGERWEDKVRADHTSVPSVLPPGMTPCTKIGKSFDALFVEPKGVILINGASRGEFCFAQLEKGGIFTSAMVDTLRKQSAGRLDWRSLVDTTARTTRELYDADFGAQQPQLQRTQTVWSEIDIE